MVENDFWKELVKECSYRPRIKETGYEFQWTSQGGHYIYPGIPLKEVKGFKEFLAKAVSFIHEGVSAQTALNRMAEKQGNLLVSKRMVDKDEVYLEPLVIFSTHIEDAEYDMLMVDQEFFVDRTEWVHRPVYGLHVKWQIGNLRVKDKTGVFLPIIPNSYVERQRLKRLGHFRDGITKVIDDESTMQEPKEC